MTREEIIEITKKSILGQSENKQKELRVDDQGDTNIHLIFLWAGTPRGIPALEWLSRNT